MTRTKTSPDRSGGRSPRRGLLAGVGLLVLTPAVATIWLFLAALPALADGGPHVSTINNGSLGINADSCAGCHRAHTAAGPLLINAADEEALCFTCHGAGGTGSTVDVATGIQYTLGTGDDVRGTTVLGALRNGGFIQAAIGSSSVYRMRNASGAFRTKVPVLAAAGVPVPEAVTSAHLTITDDPSTVAVDGNGITMPGIAWGNSDGSFSVTPDPGPAVDLTCASCHNPHGNGQYRILNPIPVADGADFVEATTGIAVTDAAPAPPGDTRNYTVIQTVATNPTLLASQVAGTYAPTQGDYFHRSVPWNSAQNSDAPNGLPATFNDQMTAWCSACHTRYLATSMDFTGDAIFGRRHFTVGLGVVCTTCHVAHGSNATMDGDYSSNFEYPDGTTFSASSRLLKIDNRGTCQACHDPTGTFPPNSSVGPAPSPAVP